MSLIKSNNDTEREYRHLVLENELSVLIVRDTTTVQSCAALSVGVGSFSDPENLLGLAHYLEHMLFMGSKKYPQENIYDKFIYEHGGETNAFTWDQETCYYFSVDNHAFQQALDIFAQFFIEPLTDPDSLLREVEAVDSEFKNSERKDTWRLSRIIEHVGNPSHPRSKFKDGNKKSLKMIPESQGINVRQVMRDFYFQHYSSNQMKLVVIGHESLDVLESWILDSFLDVPNYHRLSRDSVDCIEPFFVDGDLPSLVNVESIKEIRRIKCCWPIFSTLPYYHHAPKQYILFLLNHQAKGSLSSRLRQLGWATSCDASLSDDATQSQLLSLTLDLTKEGFKQWKQVVENIYQYIAMINEKGILQSIWDELKSIRQIKFDTLDKEGPYAYAQKLVSRMWLYPPQEILSGPYLYKSHDPALIQRILACLKPSNMLLVRLSRSFPDIDHPDINQLEPWYQIKYSTERLNATWEQQLDAIYHNQISITSMHPKPKLALPKPNQFIPIDFSIKSIDKNIGILTAPTLIKDTDRTQCWYYQDAIFQCPKLVIYCHLILPTASSTLPMVVMMNLYLGLVTDSLQECTYDANLAGMHYQLNATWAGIELEVKGHDQKLSNFMMMILERLASLRMEESRFQIIKAEQMRACTNFLRKEPCEHVEDNLMQATCEPYWSPLDRLKILANVDYNMLKAAKRTIFIQIKLEWLIHGNITSKDALALVDQGEKVFSESAISCPRDLCGTLRTVKIARGKTVVIHPGCHDPLNPNSCILNWYQIGHHDDTELIALADVCNEMLREWLFDELRTKQQLGYLVISDLFCPANTVGYQVLIESSLYTADLLNKRIEKFFKGSLLRLKSVQEEEFSVLVNAMIAKHLERPTSMYHHAREFWSEIVDQHYKFDRKQLQVASLQRFKLQDVIQFFEKNLLNKNLRRKVQCQVTAKRPIPIKVEDTKKTTFITDHIGEFKKMTLLWPPKFVPSRIFQAKTSPS